MTSFSPIAYQGIPGAYSQLAIQQFGEKIGVDFETESVDSFPQLLNSIIEESKLGFIPFENSTHGIVYTALDEMLSRPELEIIGEYYFPVEHCLLGNPKASLDLGHLKRKRVLSHWQAIGQCRKFVSSNHLAAEEFFDTAGAAEYVASLKDTEDELRYYAIASELAAEKYRLKVIKKGIQDNLDNTTRFLLGKHKSLNTNELERIIQGAVTDKFKLTLSYRASANDSWRLGQLVDTFGFSLYGPPQTRPAGNIKPQLIGNSMEERFQGRLVVDIGVPFARINDIDVFLNLVRDLRSFEEISSLGLYPRHRD